METSGAFLTIQACPFALNARSSARQVTFINVEVVMESSRTFRKLTKRGLASLGFTSKARTCPISKKFSFFGFTLVAQTCLGNDLGMRPGRVLA